jgi:uncharacterized protein with FMN-binding domain
MKKFLFSFFLIGTFAAYALFSQQSSSTGAGVSAPVVLDDKNPVSAAGTVAAVAATTPSSAAAAPPTPQNPAAADAQANLQAQGTVQIASSYPAALTLVKTTRLLTSDGKVYRLSQEVIVPARGSVSASVYADQNGSAFAIGPTAFSIPGLDSALTPYVTVSSSSAFVMARPMLLASSDASVPVSTSAPSRPASAPAPTPIAPPPPPPKPKSPYNDGTYVGDSADAYYGNVQVQVVISGGKITDVQFLDHPQDRSRSVYINDQAMPYLTSEAIQAQSANVDAVSGASETSRAFIESLSSALSQARA